LSFSIFTANEKITKHEGFSRQIMSLDGTRTENCNNHLGNQVVLTQAKRFQGLLSPAQRKQSLYLSSEEKLH